MTNGVKRTKEDIEKIVNDLGYYLLDDYIEKNKRRILFQDIYGYKYDCVLSSLLNPNINRTIVESKNPIISLENIRVWII